MKEISYRCHRFPPIVIQHAVWLYLRFTLSYRDVEELLAERGLDVSYETVRSWVLKFGPLIARRLRRSRPRPSDRWHLDEMVFSRAITANPDPGQAAYVALEKSRPEIRGRPTLVALPVPRPYSDYGRFAKYQVDESFPHAVGAFIHWLINESDWTVEEVNSPRAARHGR